jgi:hypothetical protein
MLFFNSSMGSPDQKKFDAILSAEDTFAHAVALGVWVKRPMTAWHFLLPGMFIFDFLRRSQAVRQYSAVFLYPRKVALEAALGSIEGESPPKDETEGTIRQWLDSLKMYSEALLRAHLRLIAVLRDHYSKLLREEGKDYASLLRKAYGTREKYEGHLRRLVDAEQEIDRSVADFRGQSQEIRDRLQAEQNQVEILRKKEMDRIFSKGGQ